MKTGMEQVNPMDLLNDTEGLLQYSTELVPDWINMKLNVGGIPGEHSW